jgi:hypothetical protein
VTSYEDESRGGVQYVISGLLGILNICGINFIAAITEKQFIGKLDGANIYGVKGIEFYPFQEYNKRIG